MKRTVIFIILAVFVLTAVLSGCGAKSGYAVEAEKADYYYESPAYAPEVPASDNSWSYDSPDMMTEELLIGAADSVNTAFDKIIYTADASLETLEFEQSIDDLYEMINVFGGFIESSSVTGTGIESSSYYSYRSAYFCIRVPRENYAGLTGSLSKIGNVTYCNTSAQNITASYLDTESRLTAYRTEESNLLEMMEKAETVDDMIIIQDRLSYIRYNIESLTSMLKNWDNEVDYSTVNVNIREVKRYTEEVVVPKSFGQEISDGFRSSVKWLGQALRDIVVFMAKAAPVLVLPVIVLLPAGIIVLIVLLCVRKHRKNKNKAGEQEKNS